MVLLRQKTLSQTDSKFGKQKGFLKKIPRVESFSQAPQKMGNSPYTI